MRAEPLLAASALSLAAMLLPGCPSCPSANRAPVPAAVPGGPGAPRFVALSSFGGAAQVTLLDDALVPITFDVGGAPAEAWISTQSRWTNMRGTGIGRDPVVPRALSTVPGLVTIVGATSIIALGLPTGQEDWEWVQTPSADGTFVPILDILVVPDAALELHDVAFVARERVRGTGGVTVGGDIQVLDVETNRPAILANVPLDGIADEGLNLTPTSFALAGGLIYVGMGHGLVVGPGDGAIQRTGEGIVVTIDPVTRTVRNVLRFPELTHCDQVVALEGEPAGRVIVACAGTPDVAGEVPDDGGLVILDRDPTGTAAPLVTRTLLATMLAIPSPDWGLVALRGQTVAFVSTGSAETPVLDDRLYAVDVEEQRVDLLATAPPETDAVPGGLGTGAHDPVRDADGSTLFVLPAGRAGLLSWDLVPVDPAIPDGPFTFVERPITGLATCLGLPVRAVRLVP
jgi:hypothetical protein